jgi:ADP-ribosylglycohydrolase
MRVAPIGLFAAITPEQAFDCAARAAAVTHGHPSGYLSAGALATVIRLCLDGADLASAARAAISMLGETTSAEETARALALALELAGKDGAEHTVAIAALGEGWVGEEALAIGLYAALPPPSRTRSASRPITAATLTRRLPSLGSSTAPGRGRTGCRTAGCVASTCWTRSSASSADLQYKMRHER